MSQLPSIGCIVICYPSRSIDLRGFHHNGLALAGMIVDVTTEEVVGPDGRRVPVCEIQWWGGDLGQGHESMTEIDRVGPAAATTREGHWWWPPQNEIEPARTERPAGSHDDLRSELQIEAARTGGSVRRLVADRLMTATDPATIESLRAIAGTLPAVYPQHGMAAAAAAAEYGGGETDVETRRSGLDEYIVVIGRQRIADIAWSAWDAGWVYHLLEQSAR